MKDLVFVHNNQPVTSSRLISDRFNKRHDNVLRAINNLEISDEFRLLNFEESSYINEQGREMPEFIITEKGFSILVMGFTGKESFEFKEEFVNQFFKMREKLLSEKKFKIPQTYPEALKEAARLAEAVEIQQLEIEKLNNKIEKDSSKVVFAESVQGSTNSILIREFAKLLSDQGFSIGQNRLFDYLRDKKYLNKDNEPYQNFIELGIFERIQRTVGSSKGTFTTQTTKITGKGQVYLAKKIKMDLLGINQESQYKFSFN